MNVDWESFAKRLLALNQMGFRIEQDSGHRWLMHDMHADYTPDCLMNDAVAAKHYGSFESVLDTVDKALEAGGLIPLIKHYEHLGPYDNTLELVFGEGTQ